MKLKVAVATKGSKGLEDEVSDVFGRSQTFVIAETEDGVIKSTEVANNPAASSEYGVGPVVAEKLAGAGVEVVIAGEFGPGALALLKGKNIRSVVVKAGTNVCKAIDSVIK